LSADRLEASGRDGISAGEQGHVVTEPNQFFGEVGHDAFRSSIEFRRNALPQGGMTMLHKPVFVCWVNEEL
jgi:hypothetical protein